MCARANHYPFTGKDREDIRAGSRIDHQRRYIGRGGLDSSVASAQLAIGHLPAIGRNQKRFAPRVKAGRTKHFRADFPLPAQPTEPGLRVRQGPANNIFEVGFSHR